MLNRHHQTRKIWAASILHETHFLAEAEVGEWSVKVFERHGKIVYQVFHGLWLIPCFTSADERNFPKRAAATGTRLIAELNNRQAVLFT